MNSQVLDKTRGIAPVRPPWTDSPKAAAPKADGRPADSKPKLPEPDHALWELSRRNKTPVLIRLIFGDEISGPVVRFGLYSVAIETEGGREVVVFKNAIATAAFQNTKELNLREGVEAR